MSGIGQPERATQKRIIKLFREELGYRYLGDWSDRPNNSNIDAGLLSAYLTRRGYSPAQISRALDRIRTEAGNPNRSPYDNNKAVYSLLRYGVPVRAAAGENTETIKLIDWDDPAQNDFAIAEEVTLRGNHERRPDLVLYVNGIAVGVIELKNSCVSIGDGRDAASPLIAKWQRLMGVRVAGILVRRMKTKWGSCSPQLGTIRLNLELAKKPAECLEYILVHEMAHLLEPTHNKRFTALMDRFMPKWRFFRDELNRLPVCHQEWDY